MPGETIGIAPGTTGSSAMSGASAGSSALSWLGVGSAIAGLGLNLLEGAFGAAATRKQGRIMYKSYGEQLNLLGKEENLISNAYTSRVETAKDIYGNKMTSLAERVGLQTKGLNRQFDYAAGKTNMAFSGTVDASRNLEMDKLTNQFKETRQNLMDTLGKELSELDIWRQSEQGRVASEEAGLRAQRKVAKMQSNQHFLGIF